MTWEECVRQNEYLRVRSRFDWPTGKGGFDCSPAFTLHDLAGAVSWI